MSMSRRGFLSFAWRKRPEGNPADGEESRMPPVSLPPEFDGPMLRFEGRRLGLDVEHMSDQELARAIWSAMAASGPGQAGRDGQ